MNKRKDGYKQFSLSWNFMGYDYTRADSFYMIANLITYRDL